MPLEVYSASKPAVRYRAGLLSIAIFAVATSLAVGLTWVRQSTPLGPPIMPKGWGLSIRIPRLFITARPRATTTHETIEFHASPDAERSIELAIHQVPIRKGETAESACRLVLRDDGDLMYLIHLLNPPTLERTHTTLGGLSGAELRDAESGAVVRGVVADPRRAFCVSLRAPSGKPSEEAYALFDASCASVRFDRRD